MKSPFALLLVAGLAVPAVAAPIATETFTNVPSVGRLGPADAAVTQPNNTVITRTLTGTGTVRNILVAGALSADPVLGSWSREASIQVTAPSGNTYIISPFTGTVSFSTAAVPAGAFMQPLVGEPIAGNWTFRFFETFQDSADQTIPDVTWSNLTLTFDDAAPAPVAPFSATRSVNFDNVIVTAPFNSTVGFPTRTWNNTTTGVADSIVLAGRATGIDVPSGRRGVNIPGGASVTSRLLFRVTPPGATAPTGWAVPFITSSTSTGNQTLFPLSLGTNTPANPVGTWTFEFSQNNAFADGVTAATAGWNNVTFSLASATPPSPFTDFGTLAAAGANVTQTALFTAAGQTRWFRFTIPNAVDGTNGNALDVNLADTNLAAQNDAALAIFNATGGTFVANNFNSGPGFLPQLSFGTGIRNQIADGLPFDGANQGLANPAGANTIRTIAAGTYFLGVTNGDDGTVIAPGLFSITPTTESNTGTLSVNLRYWGNANAPFDVPPTTGDAGQDIGVIGGTQTFSAAMTGTQRFKWYKFTLPSDVNDATQQFVDIDTFGALDPLNDTNIAVYDSTGTRISSNDDMVPGFDPDLQPFGGNSALSFGDSITIRDYSGVSADLPAGDGRDGQLAAGDYYLQVSFCCANYQASRFWVINDYATVPFIGTFPVNFRSSFPPVGSPCGIADLGGEGGAEGSDNFLDNNDFIVFISLFFSQDARADIGGEGGAAGSDNNWDNNDFIVFIGEFFAGQSASGCNGNP